MGTDDLFGPSENLIQRHGCGVQDDCVGCRLEGGFGAVAVAIVALFQFTDDGLFGEALLLGGKRIRHLPVGGMPAGVVGAGGDSGVAWR